MRNVKAVILLLTLTFVWELPCAARESIVTDIPMSFYGTRPAVEVMVNGKGPFLFLIDTGAQGMARADASLVQRLGLSPIGQSAASYVSSEKQVLLNEFRLETLSMGSIQFREVTALSRDYNHGFSYLPHIDGILGFELFADYLLTLDFPNKRVRIMRGELPKPDGARILNFESRNGVPFIDVSVGQLKAKAMIDSGAIRAFDFPASVVAKLPFATYTRTIGKGSSVTGEFEVREVRLQDTLSIGRYAFPEPTITFSDIDNEILIGSAMLRGFAITFDQKNHRVRFIKGNGRRLTSKR